MDTPDTLALSEKRLLGVYRRLPGVFVRGQGVEVWNSEGQRFLDFLAGIAVNSLGHCHPAVVSAIQSQAQTLIHGSNFFLHEPGVLLADRLCELSGLDKVFFSTDGTTAVETALKIARKRGQALGKTETVSLRRSFHGRSLGALSATGQGKYQDPFRPLLPGFSHIPANDIPALEAAIGPETMALILEPIQGEGGLTTLTGDYLRAAREITRKHGALLIVDEIQTGIGRTGKWLAIQHEEIEADLICLAKGLGSGFPIGACLVAEELATVLDPGEHGTTFGGGPLACAVGLAVLKTIESEALLDNAAQMGARLAEGMALLPHVTEIRGKGLMRGAVLDAPVAREAIAKAFSMGLIANATDESTIRLVPPLIVQEREVDEGLVILGESLGSV